jgi:hypothetical protein
MRLKLPLRVATAMKAGVVEKRTVARSGKKKGKVRRIVLEPRAKVAFGRKVHLGGLLVNQAGHALSDAKVSVYSRPKGGDEQLVGTVATDSSGRFSYTVEARASQSFRFVYPGTATILPVEGTATLLVKGTSTFTVKPKHVLNGQSVAFGGRVKGRPLPEAGKLLELQVRFTSGWQTFRTVRTKADGTWRIPYLFDRTCGESEFDFRAHLAAEAGWPLETGNSRTLTVRVKGRPC